MPSPRVLDPEPRVPNGDGASDAASAMPALPDTAPLPAQPLEVRVVRPSAPPLSKPEPPSTARNEGIAATSSVPDRLAVSDGEFAACKAALSALGASFEPVSSIAEARDDDCGIERPIKVSTIAPGVVLRPDAVMRCPTALALAEWVRDDVLPAARALPSRGRLIAIDHGSTYVCRRRNNRSTGKLSEHAFGNAVDVMGFRFSEGKPLRVEPRAPGGPAARFQRTVRQASCEHFTTVIGPGTDRSHADHLHLDIKQRRGGYRLCR